MKGKFELIRIKGRFVTAINGVSMVEGTNFRALILMGSYTGSDVIEPRRVRLEGTTLVVTGVVSPGRDGASVSEDSIHLEGWGYWSSSSGPAINIAGKRWPIQDTPGRKRNHQPGDPVSFILKWAGTLPFEVIGLWPYYFDRRRGHR